MIEYTQEASVHRDAYSMCEAPAMIKQKWNCVSKIAVCFLTWHLKRYPAKNIHPAVSDSRMSIL